MPEESEQNEQNDRKRTTYDLIVKPKGFGVRHIQVILWFLGLTIAVMCRSVLSVAIVPMTNNSANPAFEEIHWDAKTRGMIFAFNFWGIFPSTLATAFIIHRFGAKTPLLIAMLLLATNTILTPLAANSGLVTMCIRQSIEGLLLGPIYPMVNSLMGKWLHPLERALWAPMVNVGLVSGTIFGFLFTGFVSTTQIGWPGMFYISGGCCLLWTIAWLFLGANTPSEYPAISKDEEMFLNSIPNSTNGGRKPPWKKILTSVPVISLIIGQIAYSWNYTLFLTSTASYISEVLKMNLKSNSVFSAMPYIILVALTFSSSFGSSILIRKGYISVLTSRKLFNSIGKFGPAIFLLILAFVPVIVPLSIFLITVIISMSSFMFCGFLINHLDLTPNFSGAIVSLTTATVGIIAVIENICHGYIVQDLTNNNQWRIMFLISALMYTAGGLAFNFMVDVKVQEWNEIDVQKPCDNLKELAET